MNVTIITGASSGLGKAYSEYLLKNASKEDEIWLIARRKDKLEEIASKYKNVNIKIFSVDLASSYSRNIFFEEMKTLKPNIKCLINNAGYQKEGKFINLKQEEIDNIIDVNILATSLMIHECLPFMKKGGYIINTCSVSAFVPNINGSVYSSSKTYLLYLSRVLREELKTKQINVLALCPGNMDTEMNSKKVAKENNSKAKSLPWLNMNTIVKKSLKKAKNNKTVYTPGIFYKLYRVASKIIPQSIMVKLAKL